MTFTVDNGSDTSNVVPSGDVSQVARLELDKVRDLARVNVKLDGVVDLDERVRVTDGATVVGDEEGDALASNLDALDLAELVLGFIGGDSVDGKSALDVVDETEVFAGLFNRDDVCWSRAISRKESKWGREFGVDVEKENFQEKESSPSPSPSPRASPGRRQSKRTIAVRISCSLHSLTLVASNTYP